MDLSGFSADPVQGPVRLLFIHHSCGGQMLADPGRENGDHCIYRTHPNGGGLRGLLEKNGYEVHEASYGSDVGENTDLYDWPDKFRSKMDAVLSCDNQDKQYTDGGRNSVVMFKSCFPNNEFTGEGDDAGHAPGAPLTIRGAKAAMNDLLPEFRKHPDVLFVYMTAPPVAPFAPAQPLWKMLAKTVLGRKSPAERLRYRGALAREFNDWVKSPDGWLKGYDLKNVAVFDYYDVLTGDGRSNLSEFPTGGGRDSHPSAKGNRIAAQRLIPLLNRAVRRAKGV
ncbi:MAG: hypothetical protein GXP54_04310 [Deltaproteobacteria bacterium]|nr:hypothetical protein [Deltaproteobacteria bacterium]